MKSCFPQFSFFFCVKHLRKWTFMFFCQVLFHWFSHCSNTVLMSRPKHTYTKTLVNKAMASNAWSEKKENKWSPSSLPLSTCNTTETAQHLIKAIRWMDQQTVIPTGLKWLQHCGEGMSIYWSISAEHCK